jgi:hypothetical protein
LTTAPGLTAIAALITAIAGVSGFYGGTRAAAQAPQPAVTVTVTAPARTVTFPAQVASSAASTPPPQASTPAATTTPARTAYLADQKPLQDIEVADGVINGPQEIGARTYADSVRLTCSYPGDDLSIYANPSSLVYEVATYTTLKVLLGVPSDAANASGNTATIKFFKDGTTNQLATADIALDQPQNMTIRLNGASQVTIDCSGSASDIDVALGNATLSS